MNLPILCLIFVAIINVTVGLPQYEQQPTYTAIDVDDDDDNSNDDSYETSDELRKRIVRDVSQDDDKSASSSTPTKRLSFELSDVLKGVETSIVHSAIALAAVYKPDSNESFPLDGQALKKRSTSDGTPNSDGKLNNESTKTTHVHAKPGQEDYIAIDHVAVYKPTAFPILTFLPTGHQTSPTSSPTAIHTSQTTTVNSTEKPLDIPVTTVTKTTAPSTPTESTKSPAQKDKEDKIKDKVAEIEADPVILSARV